MSATESEWKDAVIGSIFEDEVKDRKIKRNIFKSRQGKMPVIFDVKVDSEGNGFTCSDPEHAGIMSALAIISGHLKMLENGMGIVCAELKKEKDFASHLIDAENIVKEPEKKKRGKK